MGAEIHLYVDFSNVEREQWEAVYDETLELIDNYPFMDKIVDEESYTESFIYADRTRDRFLTPWFPELRGWYTIGDLKSFECGEAFFLIRDIGYYKEEETPPGTGEIYFNFLDRYGAALIEDRLKPHAAVSGDIDREDLEKSVHWANKHLETPISLPDRCCYTRLLTRIKRQVRNEKTQLKALFFLLLYPHNKELGDFIRENFSREAIRELWAKEFQRFIPQVIGDVIGEYLDMHFSLEDLFTVLTTKDYDFAMSPKKCLRTVLITGKLNQEQLENVLEPNTHEEPETNSFLYGEDYPTTKEIRDSALHFIEESELSEIVYSVLRKKKVDEEYFRNRKITAEQKASLDQIIDFFENIEYSSETGEPIFPKEYDIEENAELIYWKEGASIRPDVERDIQKMLDISDGMIEELEQLYGERNEDYRIHTLLWHNQKILIRRETWEYILSHILDDAIYFRFLSLISLQAGKIQMHYLLRSVCNNLDFLTQHLLSRPISV